MHPCVEKNELLLISVLVVCLLSARPLPAELAMKHEASQKMQQADTRISESPFGKFVWIAISAVLTFLIGKTLTAAASGMGSRKPSMKGWHDIWVGPEQDTTLYLDSAKKQWDCVMGRDAYILHVEHLDELRVRASGRIVCRKGGYDVGTFSLTKCRLNPNLFLLTLQFDRSQNSNVRVPLERTI